MSSTTETGSLSDSLRIETSCWYLAEQSHPEAGQYAFSYTIRIHNDGRQPAQLLTRHWLITDAESHKQEVHGDGVVGEQPTIQPGDVHTYTSGTIIETPVGTMEGRYGMVTPEGEHFSVLIPVFRLAVPGVLN